MGGRVVGNVSSSSFFFFFLFFFLFSFFFLFFFLLFSAVTQLSQLDYTTYMYVVNLY